ncbi:hypothetical protein M6D81_28195 [Paenibacillus sp. J5C_2022]|uniref:hypothetical protein n=1 Tax=Paenibacillus sp. J5C2022 TaxID=2977129 RepID=UPI0021D1E05B|nr:hypothetical protein [Paenibacillus sp. J5C2022]MCU6712586.1 hypothetical protein [Paenibacillus sp. J5C2022]
MKRYNFVRPLLLIAVALLVKSLVTNLCIVMGMEPALAENIGFMGMIVAAVVVYSRISRNNRKKQ